MHPQYSRPLSRGDISLTGEEISASWTDDDIEHTCRLPNHLRETFNFLQKEDREGNLSHMCCHKNAIVVTKSSGHLALCYSALNFHPDLPLKIMI